MIENVLDTFCGNIFTFLAGESIQEKTMLIKKHSENLNINGDVSFLNTVIGWHEFLDSEIQNWDPGETLLQFIGKNPEDLIEKSKKWVLQISKVKDEKNRVHVFLDRKQAIEVGLLEALRNNVWISERIQENTLSVRLDPRCEKENCITSLRCKYLAKVVKNLYSISSVSKTKAPNILVTSKSYSTDRCVNDHNILCGVVLNAKTGVKETSINADEFIRIRQDEMTLIAQHKYGVRVSTDSKWKEFIDHLGESSVVFELLQIRPNAAVKINFGCASAGSSKGAAFILYNCARLETIIRTYNGKVDEGVYPPLPALENTDLTLLTQEDEWNLVFNYILGFPSLLQKCVEINEQVCEFRPHQICNFLSAMVRVFSQYYRKIRILTEPRKHLLPVMFARIHMLKVLNDNLKMCLRLLNIKSVSQM